MTQSTPLLLSREAARLGSDRDLRRAARRGEVVRVATGAYVNATAWRSMSPDARYRTRVIAAAAGSRPMTQFSHDSAAAMWRLPSIGPWPSEIHELLEPSAGGSSRSGRCRHYLGRDPLAVEIDDVKVTSLARTVIDMASTTSFVRAVAMADAAFALSATDGVRLDAALLLAVMEGLTRHRSLTRATKVAAFASPLAGSPGESFARVQFAALGLPAPELQVSFHDDDGHIGDVDFYWPELDLIGEFDGWSKYGDARRFQRDLSPAEVLRAEKIREDRLRRRASGLFRLDWELLQDRQRLATHLRPYGLVARRGLRRG